ncbi:hypothetical protein M9H77_21135 [Catharanthus roseus]|uniref:Uncharacterized protein n=1 Tax=Catharanthus roseus TaxID=4058 RepID=A0ACC0ALF9_CATRO|nr:hypothetical protein M9H77_21135 [Catharanthus roseus]
MYLAAKFISDGSEDLLEILGPGIVGGLIVPILSSLPDALDIIGKLNRGFKRQIAYEIGIECQGINLDEHDAFNKVMKEFDTSGDSRVDLSEFIEGIKKWLTEAKKCSKYQHQAKKEMQLLSDFHTQKRMEHYLLGDEDDEEVEKIENARWNANSAMAVTFAHPFVDTINTFSTKTDIPLFFVAYVVIPFVRVQVRDSEL